MGNAMNKIMLLMAVLMVVPISGNSQTVKTYTPEQLREMVDKSGYPEQLYGKVSEKLYADFIACIADGRKMVDTYPQSAPAVFLFGDRTDFDLWLQKVWLNTHTVTISCSKSSQTMTIQEGPYK
jgi:hypothetical protein